MKAMRPSGECSCIMSTFSDRGGGESSDGRGVGT